MTGLLALITIFFLVIFRSPDKLSITWAKAKGVHGGRDSQLYDDSIYGGEEEVQNSVPAPQVAPVDVRRA